MTALVRVLGLGLAMALCGPGCGERSTARAPRAAAAAPAESPPAAAAMDRPNSVPPPAAAASAMTEPADSVRGEPAPPQQMQQRLPASPAPSEPAFVCDLKALAPALAKNRRAPRKEPQIDQKMGINLDGCVGLGPLTARPRTTERRCEKQQPIKTQTPAVEVTILELSTRSAEECVPAWVWIDRQLASLRNAYQHIDAYDRVENSPVDPAHQEVELTVQFAMPARVVVDKQNGSRAARTVKGRLPWSLSFAIGDVTDTERKLNPIRIVLSFDQKR